MSKKRKRRRLRKPIRRFMNLLLIIVLVISIILFMEHYKKEDNGFFTNVLNGVKSFINSKNEGISKYNNCLAEEYSDEDLTETLKNKMDETSQYLQRYSASVGYEEPNSKFIYKYNENRKYYAASTIKMLDALYIYDKASKGEIKLTDTITYQSKHLRGASLKMGSKKIGDKIKIKDLVSYAVIYSDNISHAMLLDYIGKSTLREYGKSLGAKFTLNSDEFGEISVDDALSYLEALNNYLNTDTDDAKELKSYFVNSQQNYLNFPDKNIEAVQKYGEYPGYYHENGIVYVEKPYLVTILTNYGNNEKIIRAINSKVLELHNTFIEERQNRCSKYLQ